MSRYHHFSQSAALLICGCLLFVSFTVAADSGKGYLTGSVVLKDGSPLSGAFVYLFDADKRSGDGAFWRSPDHIVGQLDRHGRFDIEVDSGNYYLTIIRRASGRVWGPLQEGDIYYQHRVEAGSKEMITIKADQETDLGRMEGRRFAGRGTAGYPEYEEIAAIYGTVTDSKGKPVLGAFILVYDEPDRLGPPLFSGGPSKIDGSFHLPVFKEGTFYLVARTGSGPTGKRTAGMLLGRYGGAPPTPLVIKAGDVKTEIDIVLAPIGLGGR